MGKESLVALDTRPEGRRTPSEMISSTSLGDEAGEETCPRVCVSRQPLRANAVPRRISAVTHTIAQPKSWTETERQPGSRAQLMSYPTLAPGPWHGKEVSRHVSCDPGYRRDTHGGTSRSAAHTGHGNRCVRVGRADAESSPTSRDTPPIWSAGSDSPESQNGGCVENPWARHAVRTGA